MPHWLLQLDLSDQDLAFLQSQLTGEDLAIERDGPFACLKLSKPPQPPDPLSVHSEAQATLERLNGAAKLLNPHFNGARSTVVHIVNDDGTRKSYGFLTVPRPDYTLHAFRDGDPTLSTWLRLSQTDASVARAFVLYGALEHDWKNLYMVVEVVKADLGGWTKLKATRWIEPSLLDSFTQAANSYPALGREARHGTDKTPAPVKRPTLHQVEDMVRTLLTKWIASKVAAPASRPTTRCS